MKTDLRLLGNRLRPAIEPAVALAFFVLWMIMFRGELSLDLIGMRRFVVSWIAVLGLIALSVALSRQAPRLAIAVSLVAVVGQFALPIARFWPDSWPMYTGYLVLFFSLGLSAPIALRKVVGVLVGVLSVLVTTLMTIPALGSYGVALIFGRSASMGAGTALRNLAAVLAVVLVLGYGSWLAGCLIRRLLETRAAATDSRLDVLSVREREVFALAAAGLTNPEIAGQLYVSEATVKSHMTSILGKLELSSRSRLIAFAHENALVG